MRLITTFLAVALGVAFVSGVLVLTDTVNRTFDDLFSDVFRDTDAVVRSNQEIDQGFGGGEVRGTIDEDLVDEVRDVDGVADADVSVDGFARIIDKDGDPMGNPAMGAPTPGPTGGGRGPQPLHHLRRRPSRERRRGGDRPLFGQERGLRGGRHRAGPDPGRGCSTTRCRHRPLRQRRQPGRSLVRHVHGGGGPAGAGRARKVSSISAAAGMRCPSAVLVSNIEDALGPDAGVEVITGAQITKENQDDIQQALSLTIFLGIFGIIAVVVGAFVIYNAFSIIVAQRTREMALLRAGVPAAGRSAGPC